MPVPLRKAGIFHYFSLNGFKALLEFIGKQRE